MHIVYAVFKACWLSFINGRQATRGRESVLTHTLPQTLDYRSNPMSNAGSFSRISWKLGELNRNKLYKMLSFTTYTKIIRNSVYRLRDSLVSKLLRVIPRHRRRYMYFMHDGTSYNANQTVYWCLNQMFELRLIGCKSASHLSNPHSL